MADSANSMETHYHPAPLLEWAAQNPVNTIPKLFQQAFDKHGASQRNYLGQKVNGAYRFETYQQIRDKAMQFASALIELGLLPTDRVALIATNRPEWVITDLGTMHAACIHTPLYPSLAADAIKAILSGSGARLVICATDRQLQAVLSAENELPALEQVVCLFDPGHVKSSRKLWSWESVLDLGSQHLSRNQAEIYRRLAALQTHDV